MSAPPATGTQPARRKRGWVSRWREGPGLAQQSHPLLREGGAESWGTSSSAPQPPKLPGARWAAAQKMPLAPSRPEVGQRPG